MKTQQLLIATHNPAKKQELGEGFTSGFAQSGHVPSLLTLDDLHISADPEETETSFLANAQLKARYFSQLSNLPTVADDGGIEIDALGGAPGVHSKRWLGREAKDIEMIEYTLEKLKDVPLEKRTAHFTVCLYFINPETGFETSVTKSVHGHIALSPSNQARIGFPYRALFVVDAYNKYYDELSEEEHARVNHRLKAVKQLVQKIEWK